MPRRNEQMDELLTELREGYNPPPPTPREEMWAIIQSRLRAAPGSGVHSMDEARRARAKRLYRPLGWITARNASNIIRTRWFVVMGTVVRGGRARSKK